MPVHTRLRLHGQDPINLPVPPRAHDAHGDDTDRSCDDRWPVPAMPAAWGADSPAAHPRVEPRAALGRGGVSDQERPGRLVSAPFSTFNMVRSSEEVPFEPTPQLVARDRTRPGDPSSAFEDTVRIQRRQGGDWVRAYMTRHPDRVRRDAAHPRDRDRDFVAWTSAETMQQVSLWLDSCRSDMQAFARVGDTHRPRTRTFIIPAAAHRGGGDVVHDLRPFSAAAAAGTDTSTVAIPPVQADAPIVPRLNAERLRARMQRAGVRDRYGMQQLLTTGLFHHSTASKDTVLMPNYLPIARHARRAAEQAAAEQRDGILSPPYPMLPFLPCRIHPYSAVEQGAKVRLCCDMSAPQSHRDGGGLWSINASVPFADGDLIAKMRLTSTRDFAADVGVLQAGALEPGAGPRPRVWLASCDWARFYRQLPKATRELWAHVLWLHPAGPQVDLSTCFGDAAAPSQSNRVQVRAAPPLAPARAPFPPAARPPHRRQ